MQINFNQLWKKDLGLIYKEISIDRGKQFKVDIDLKEVKNIYANYKVNNKHFTDSIEILDIENGVINIPFKSSVLEKGKHELEIVAVMKNGNVLPSNTFNYTVNESLENEEPIETETNYPILIELLDLAGNKLIDMDKSIQKVDTSIENMTNEISSYKEATTNELEESFNNYSNNTTSNITRVLNNKTVEVDNVVSAKSNELDIKFTTKANEITKALNDEINKVDNTLTNKLNEVNEILDNKINEVDELIVEVENAEQLRQEELENITNQLSSYSSDLNTVKNNIKEHNTRLNALEQGAINNSKIDNLEAKVENHETRIKANENTLKHHDILLKSLNILDETISIENEEGAVISLPQSKDGAIIIDELQGNTLVNYCTNGSEELTLNNEINVQGTDVTLTDTVDNGKVDVVCEGNTLVNLCKSKTIDISASHSHFNITDITIKANIPYTYIFDCSTDNTEGVLVYYTDFTFSMLTPFVKGRNIKVVTVNADKQILRIGRSSTLPNVVLDNFMLLEGDYTNKPIPSYFEGMKSAFELEDNKVEIISSNSDNTLSNTHPIQLSEPLRGLPNGVCDKFVKQGGKWYVERNCKEIILDGTQSIQISGSNTTYPSVLRVWLQVAHVENLKEGGSVLCDKLPVMPAKQDVPLIWCLNGFDIHLPISTNSTKTEAIQWLSENPTTVVYQVATPTYEEITDPQVITYLDATHISNNSTIPCNMQVKNSEYNAIIKPSTQYTVAFDTDKSGEVGINLGGAKVTTTNNVATITTPSTLTDNSLRLYGKGIKASNIRLLEGDKTNYIPSFFEGVKSCFEDKEQDSGSYEVEIMSYNENKSDSIQLQLNEPLRAVGDVKDRFILKDGKLMIERNCGVRECQEGDLELDSALTDKINTVYVLNEPMYEEVLCETQNLILECFENGILFIDTLIPPTVSVTYSANKPVVAKLNQVDNITNVNTEDIAITQMAVDFLLMSSLGEEIINFKVKGGTNMSAYFASRIIKGALKYEDVISKYPNYKEDIDLILIAEGYGDLIVEL